MLQEAWNFTYVATREQAQAIQKFIGRRLKVRCVPPTRLRDDVIEECCRALCQDCANGKLVRRDGITWWHPTEGHQCGATQLREGLRDKTLITAGGMLRE